jgi:hypothetical protein
MINVPAPITKTVYLDTGTIQTLLDTGEYTNAREAARAKGIDFATTTKVLMELLKNPLNKQTDALKRFNQNPENFILEVSNPAGFDFDKPDGGEDSLVRRILEERAAGNSTSEIYTQETAAIGRYRSDPSTADIAFRRFGDGIVQGRPTPGMFEHIIFLEQVNNDWQIAA